MSNLRVSKNDYLFHVPLPVQPSLKFNSYPTELAFRKFELRFIGLF